MDERYVFMFIMMWLSSFLLSVYKIVEHGIMVGIRVKEGGRAQLLDF